MALGATLAQNASSAWQHATVAPDATLAPDSAVELYAEVKGELRVPNTINFSLFPTLDPFAKAVYYQLYLLSYGFQRDTCTIGLAKLASAVRMSQRKVQDTVRQLEKRKLIQRSGAIFGGSSKGNLYRVFLPSTLAPNATVADNAILAPGATVAPSPHNQRDDDLKNQSSSKAKIHSPPVEKHSLRVSTRREKEPENLGPTNEHLDLTRRIYCQVTGNPWTEADLRSYRENRITQVPTQKIISVIETVANRTPTKINSFNYFVKEILALLDPHSRSWQKRCLEKIIRRIRENHVGHSSDSRIDFLEDVKRTCAREGVRFDNDLFNELRR